MFLGHAKDSQSIFNVMVMPHRVASKSRVSALFCTSAALLLLSGCPGLEPSLDEGDELETTGVEIRDTGEAETGDGDGDGDGDGETGDGDGDGDGEPPSGECGDEVVSLGETCDDGNLVAGDGCSEACSIEGQILPCGDKIYACGDGIDNDGDGQVDTDDPECISPCDDDEASFRTDLPNEDCKADCFFDSDSGVGNDQCEWNLKCDPQNPGAQVGCEYDPDFGMCELEVSPECLDKCAPLVPNGCDCFGCCEIAGDFYYLDSSSECSLDNLGACESCTFYEGCNNPCEPELCELCFGQDPSELPEGCEITCTDESLMACESSLDCEEGTFCQTGCCVPIEIP
jgi:cysteine-rich repeat protein